MRKLALYARVSTTDQHPETQLASLREYAQRRGAEAVEFVDHGVSGRKDSRPALDRMLRDCRAGRVSALVVVKLDRLARSVRHLTNLVAELAELDVALVVLDQNLDTSTPSGRLLFHVLGAIGEFEAELIRERTRAGLAAARRRGSRLGRPHALAPETVECARALRATGKGLRECARELAVPLTTLRRALAA